MSLKKMNLVKDHGSGIWFTIHFKAYKISKPQHERDYVKFIYDLANEFPCEECYYHFQDYIKLRPPEYEWGREVQLKNGKKCNGLFYWSWEFHNAVNKRIGKKSITAEEAYDIYYGGGPKCDKSCKYIPPNTDYRDFMRSFDQGLIDAKPL
jgi:hypothetical protein